MTDAHSFFSFISFYKEKKVAPSNLNERKSTVRTFALPSLLFQKYSKWLFSQISTTLLINAEFMITFGSIFEWEPWNMGNIHSCLNINKIWIKRVFLIFSPTIFFWVLDSFTPPRCHRPPASYHFIRPSVVSLSLPLPCPSLFHFPSSASTPVHLELVSLWPTQSLHVFSTSVS